MNIKYALIDPAGDVLGLEDSAEDALYLASERIPDATIEVEDLDEEPDYELNPPDPSRHAELALRRTGLPQLTEREVLGMTIEEAHRRLELYYRDLLYRGEKVEAYKTPVGMREKFLGQNYKTAKQIPGEEPSDVQGLSLVPHHMIRDIARLDDKFGKMPRSFGQGTLRALAATHCAASPAWSSPVTTRPNSTTSNANPHRP